MAEKDETQLSKLKTISIWILIESRLVIWIVFILVIVGDTPLNVNASVASAIATMILAILTALYVLFTKKLVDETRESRKDEIERARLRREREKQKLRQAIKTEIETGVKILENLRPAFDYGKLLENIDVTDYSDKRDPDSLCKEEFYINRPIYNLLPSTVYQNNSGNIGLLSEEEVTVIMIYYSTVDILSAIHDPEMRQFTITRSKVREELQSNLAELNALSDHNLIEEILNEISFDENGGISYYSLLMYIAQFSGSFASGVIKDSIEEQR